MVSVRWLQGCRAWGDTLDKALRAVPDNIRAMLEARHAHGDLREKLDYSLLGGEGAQRWRRRLKQENRDWRLPISRFVKQAGLPRPATRRRGSRLR